MDYLYLMQSRYRLIFKYTGLLSMMVGAALLSPLLSLFFYPGDSVFIKYFIYSSLLAIVVGAVLYSGTGKKEAVSLTLKEGGIIVLLSWFLAILFSALPFIWGLGLTWTAAIFEVVSGWTTTGLSVIDVEKTPAIYLLWRSIMQLMGGAGLVVIALSSILPMQGMGLYQAEGRSDRLLPHVRRSTRMIMIIYLGYVLGGIFLYYLAGMSLFAAVNHSMAAISTGGFSTVTASIGHWNSVSVELVTIVLMFLGTINFATHYALLQGKLGKFFRNAEIKMMGVLLAFFTPLVIFGSLQGIYQDLGESLRYGFFQLVTALSTTGFATIDFNTWPVFANLIIIVLMLIGGGTGSTAGGIKQLRVYMVMKSIYWEIRDQFFPENRITEDYLWRGEERWYIRSRHIREAANYIILYLVTYLAGVLIFIASGYKLEESLFEFASALGTVGLSVGITGADAPAVILWTEIFGMFLGRLEFLIIIYAVVKIVRDVKYTAFHRQ